MLPLLFASEDSGQGGTESSHRSSPNGQLLSPAAALRFAVRYFTLIWLFVTLAGLYGVFAQHTAVSIQHFSGAERTRPLWKNIIFFRNAFYLPDVLRRGFPLAERVCVFEQRAGAQIGLLIYRRFSKNKLWLSVK